MKSVAKCHTLAATAAARRTFAHKVSSRAIRAHLSLAENFIRPHILELAPYKPILPLDVLSGPLFSARSFLYYLTDSLAQVSWESQSVTSLNWTQTKILTVLREVSVTC